MRINEFFKVIADLTRYRIIMLLAQEKLCVCEIQGVLKLSQPKISKHLAILRKNDLVVSEKREKFIMYSLNYQNQFISAFIDDLLLYISHDEVLLNDQKNLLDKERYFCECKQKNTWLLGDG